MMTKTAVLDSNEGIGNVTRQIGHIDLFALDTPPRNRAAFHVQQRYVATRTGDKQIFGAGKFRNPP